MIDLHKQCLDDAVFLCAKRNFVLPNHSHEQRFDQLSVKNSKKFRIFNTVYYI